MKKLITIGFAVLTSAFTFAQIPSGYYNSAEGLTGYELKTRLSQIITNGHQDRGYGNLMDIAYRVGDLDKYYENNNTILDIYSERPNGPDAYEYVPGVKECGNYNAESICYNREHIFPQGFFNEAAPMRNDYHHVLPTDGYVNGRRSNFPFGKVANATWTSTNGSKVGSSANAGYNGTVFEPIDEFKGDVARILLYFVTRYQSRLGNFSPNNTNNPLDGSTGRSFEQWQVDVLLAWHALDPVSPKEIDRNNYAYTYQGNRNPYIDHPEYVTMIWSSSTLSAQDSELKNTLKISQNPVKNGEIIVEGKDIAQIETAQIISMTGQMIQEVKNPFKNSNRLVLKNKTKGNYILKLDNQTLKFIVQ